MVCRELTSRRSAGGGRLLTAAAVLFVLLLASSAVAEQPPTNLTVREDQGVYRVDARFLVDQPPSVVLAVLTDYEEIPRFMPQIESSIVLERGAGRTLVEQEAVSRLMAFSKRVHLVLEIEERAGTLRFRDRCGRSFKSYEGTWRVSEQNGRTEILYELTTQPSFDVPEFLVKRLLRRDSVQTIEQLRREMAARSLR